MAEEKKNGGLTIQVPNIFDTQNNPGVKMVSIVDATSKNGFRSFGVPAEDIISQRKQTGRDGKVHTLSTVSLRDDPTRPYDTSIYAGVDEKGKPQYVHAEKTGQEIYDMWQAQATKNQNKQGQKESVSPDVKASNATPAKSQEKNIIINNVPDSNIFRSTNNGKPYTRIRIPDEASNCGYGYLRVMPNRVFKQPNRSPKLGDLAHAEVSNVNLGPAGTDLYYQIQNDGGKWTEKKNPDGTSFTNVDLQGMWKEQQANLMAERTGALMEKGAALAEPKEQMQSQTFEYDPSEDEPFV